MATVLLDIRDVLRGMRRDRLYAGTVVGTLALTLGATTAVFSIVDGVLLKPLAYREAQRLVSIREVVREASAIYPSLPANAHHFEAWRQQATSFAAIAALDFRMANLSGAGDAVQLSILRARGSLFDVLGTQVAMGRALRPDDEQPDRPAVAVISQRLWHERLGSNPQVVGRSLTLGGRPYTIVGVLPRGFELPEFDPLSGAGSLTTVVDAIVPLRPNFQNIGWMGQFNYPVVARLRPGVTLDQARAELEVLQQEVARTAQREANQPVALGGAITPLDESIVGRARLGLLLLLGAIGAVVLIACSNLANLSLTRAVGRMRDAAVRTALGASRARLIRQVVLEQLVLAAAGGALGLLVAWEALHVFVRTAPVNLPRVNEVTIDARVIAFAGIVAGIAGLAVALLPAWRIAGRDVQATLRAGGHGATDRGGQQVRGALLALQVALSVTLLVVTALLVTSFIRLLRIDPGFKADGVVALDIAPLASRYPDTSERAALYDRVLERVERLPGVTSVAWTSLLPLSGETWVDVISREGDTRPVFSKPSANYRFISPDYFRTLSMPMVRGRGIARNDRGGATVPAVISQRTASTIWPGEDAIGRTFLRADPGQLKKFEVVGIVADDRPTALDTPSPLMVYVPYWFNNEGKSVLVVRVAGDAAAAIGDVRRAIREVDAEIAIDNAVPLTSVVDKALEGRRYQMWLFVAFGFVALVIATIGVYATTAYGVSRRRREMNLRVALGARTSQVFALVVRQSAAALAAGLVAGCAGAATVGTLVAGLVFEGRARDPLVMTAVVVLVGAAGLAACATAAKQGLRINPAAALRDD
jgi:putative ABC transport system permease protein